MNGCYRIQGIDRVKIMDNRSTHVIQRSEKIGFIDDETQTTGCRGVKKEIGQGSLVTKKEIERYKLKNFFKSKVYIHSNTL